MFLITVFLGMNTDVYIYTDTLYTDVQYTSANQLHTLNPTVVTNTATKHFFIN